MIIVLFHMLYLLGKYVYKSYHIRKLRALCDVTKVGELAESFEMLDEISLDSEALSAPKNETYVMKFSPPAYMQRYNAVADVLIDPRYEGKLRKIVDFGCAELAFLTYMKNTAGIEEILCVDVDRQLLEANKEKAAPLTIEYLCCRKKQLVIELYEGNVTHNDSKLEKTDAVICIELIEHLYPDTLMDLPFNIFGYIMPKVVVITTPNADFNVLFPNFSGFRHPDHKFEWTREQFQDWAQNIVMRYPCYDVTFHGICDGPAGTEEYGACSQMAVFHRVSPIEEYNQIRGVDGLFKTVSRYDYPIDRDTRSDEQKILDEASYYINFLCFKDEEYIEEIYLSHLLKFMEKYTVSIEILRTILVEGGWTVEEREDGLVVLNPQYTDSNSDYDYDMGADILYDDYDEGDEWNADHEPRVLVSPNADEEPLLPQNPYTNDWNEESSIIIPENRSIIHENTYLFDGENSLLEDRPAPEESCAIHNDDVRHSNNIAESPVFIERELPSNSISLALDDTEMDDGAQTIDSNASSVRATSSAISSSGLQLEDTTKNSSVDNITIEPALTQNDEIILRTAQGVISTLNFQPYLSISRSSTSPEPFFFNSELNNSLQNHYANDQSGSYNNQFLLNSTFHESEVANEAITSIEESTVESALVFRESLPEEDHAHGREINFPKYAYPNCSKINNSCSPKRDNIVSVKNQVCENSDMADMVPLNVHGSSFNNQPKYTSSPKTKTPATNIPQQSYLKPKELIPAINSKPLLSATEAIGQTLLDADSELLNNTSQKSNSDITSTETIKLCTTSSSSDVSNTSKYDVGCSASDNTPQGSYLENKEINSTDKLTSAGSMRGINEELAERKGNHETDVVGDVQNVDAHHILSLGSESTKHKNGNAHCTLATELMRTDSTDKKTHVENMISDIAQSDVSKDGLSPLRELLSFKLQSDSKRSFECAKETSVLETDKFVPCQSNKDTSNIQLTSALKGEESVGTSKDVNISGLMSNEAKPSSPFETPPNSWSPEIMDSGYPNSASAQDITPEYDLSSIAQDHIPDSESPSVAEAPRLGVLEPIEVENGDLANNNRDDEGNNMIAADANDIENLQPLIDVLENDLENENDIYVMQNGFPIWLLRILNMANPLEFDMQPQQNLRVPDEVADGANYVGHDEGFDSSSSENESDIAYNETENDNEHGE